MKRNPKRVLVGMSGGVDSSVAACLLHEQGFETFPELFDETYDSIADDYQRHDAVQKSVWSAVERWQRNELEISSETAQKLQHNHQRVFDRDLTINKFYNEVVVDILEFLS
jgi:tRNA U34 2-thiouridine synthase MnmA/TrmU